MTRPFTAPTPFLLGDDRWPHAPEPVSFQAMFRADMAALQRAFQGDQTVLGEAIRSALSEAAYEEASEAFDLQKGVGIDD
jgi:hypothetical protein